MIFLSFSWLTSSTSSTQVYALIVIVRDSSCALAAKIFEYNFEVEYPSSTSASSAGEITLYTQPNLKTYLKEYERVRWLPTTSLTVKAAILGERPTIYPWIGCYIGPSFRASCFIFDPFAWWFHSGYLEVGPWLLGNVRWVRELQYVPMRTCKLATMLTITDTRLHLVIPSRDAFFFVMVREYFLWTNGNVTPS